MTERSQSAGSAILMGVGLGGGGAAWYFGWPFLAVGVFLCSYACVAWRVFGNHRFWRFAISGILLLIGGPPLAVGLQQIRCRYQPRPSPTQVQEFEGVEYIREVLQSPHSAVIHILKVDLAAEGVEVLVTPPDYPEEEHAVRPRTTSMFLEEFGVQAAINANHFSPFEREEPRTYLAATAGQKSVLGGAASNGVRYCEPKRYCSILHISEDQHAEILSAWPESPHTGVAGIARFIVDGRPVALPEARDQAQSETSGELPACTAVGVDRTGRELFLVVVDGDLAPYSSGMALGDLADVLLSHGVYNALGLDGGGSSTMVIEGSNGRARRLNQPVQGDIPGIERPVANHIGIYCRRVADE